MYEYNATILRIVDGDTIDARLEKETDIGFKVTVMSTLDQRLRLAGIDAPEPRGDSRLDGLASGEWLAAQIPPGSRVRVHTLKPQDKYGRYLAVVYKVGADVSLNDEMIAAGHAVAY